MRENAPGQDRHLWTHHCAEAVAVRWGPIGRIFAKAKRLLAAPRPVPAAPAPHPAPAPPAFRRLALVGLLAGTAVVAGAVVGGGTFVSHLPGAWFFGTPGGPLGSVADTSKRASGVAVLAVYGGLAALSIVWWKLLRALRDHPGTAVRQVVHVIAVWSLPFLLAPPLFSRDVYSYAGQGQLVNFHIDPYLYGPGVLGATPFSLLPGPLWSNTPSPYGPVFLWLDGVTTGLSGHHVLGDLVLLRLLAVAGVALMVAGLPTLARRVGRDPAAAVVLGAGSPLVLGTLIGGEHNDALMVGLLVAGLAAWLRWGPLPGIVLCTLATGVKFPAALGVVLIGWNWPGADARIRQRVVTTLGALGIAAATLTVVSAVTGIGWGWVTTAGAPNKVYTGVTPVDALSRAVGDALNVLGAGVSLGSVRSVATVGAMALAVALGTWLLWRSPRAGPVRSLGLSLLVLALLSPVLWAWYTTWGLVLLAPVATGLLRRAVVWLTVAEAIIGASSVIGVLRAVAGDGAISAVLVVAGIAAVASLAALPTYELRRSPWSGQRAVQPAGDTRTAIQRPQSGQ